MKGRIFSLGILFVCLMFAVPAIPLLPFSGEVEYASGNVSSIADQSGYIWIDSKDPDPKVEYDYKDIHSTGSKVTFTNGYTYYSSRYYAHQVIDLPFTFDFYGVPHDEIRVAVSGAVGFTNCLSTSYFYSWTYSYNIPNSRTPDDTINVYAGYGMGMPESWGGAGVFYEAGVDDDGTKFFVIQWYRVSIYYYYAARYSSTAYTMDFEVVLYEDGRILCQYKDVHTSYSSSYSYGDGALLGIESPDGTHGLQYSRDSRYSVAAGQAILYKQYFTSIDAELSEGYGEDGDIYPAFGGHEAWEEEETRNIDDYDDHWVRINIWSERGIEYLSTIDLYIHTESNPEGFHLSYNVASGTFAKHNDFTKLLYYDPSYSLFEISAENPNHNVTVTFHYDFSFSWYDYNAVDLTYSVTGIGVMGSSGTIDSAYTVEPRMVMVGNLSITNGRDQVIESGAWVLGGDTLYFSGIHLEYFGIGDSALTPPSIRIHVLDKMYVKHFGPATDLDTYIYIDPYFVDLLFRLRIDGIPDDQDRSDRTLRKDFTFRVDSDKPGTPGEIILYPDDLEEEPRDYDNDRLMFAITWTDAVDLSSGVAFYHISLNEPHATADMEKVQTVEKETYSVSVDSIPEGVNRIYLWAEDAVGNHGPEVFSTIRIDLTGVYFEAFYPSSDVWLSDLRPTCTVLVNDTITGVDPLSIEYETSTSGEANLIGEWEQVQDSYAPGNSLRVVVVGWFGNGKDNFIRFRAKDLAGNDYSYSEPYNIWIDADQPMIRLKSPADEDDFQINPVQNIQIQIDDKESGVDAESIEYRFTTAGTDKYTPWKPYKDAESGNSVIVNLRLTLKRGDENFVQVRASDLAGNPLKTSRAYNIKVNTYPMIDITSPTGGEVLYSNVPVTFDATDSYDLDRDSISFKWFKSGPEGMEPFGITALMTANFVPGEHTIKLIVTDSVENSASYSFTILVEPPMEGLVGPDDGDSDLDGIPNWWEIQYHLDPLDKDSDEDVDTPNPDGFTNLQEWHNRTDPTNPWSHPPIPYKTVEEEETGPLSSGMWPIWVILVALILAIVITMSVIQRKKSGVERRIKTIRNMRKIMPSVSWEQITTTAALAPFAQAGLSMPQDMSTALPAAQAVDLSTALPPVQEHSAEAEVSPEPAPAPAPVPEAAPAPAPAPAPVPAPEPVPAPAVPPVGSVPAPAPIPGDGLSNLPAPDQPPQQ